jgi:hypothetical protein
MTKRKKKKIQSIIIKPKQRPKIKTEEEMRQFLHTRLKGSNLGSNKKKDIERRGKYKNDYFKEL